ncbi:MAG TPA: helix-turn-helix transcriptional regulator [Candidatus Saccharimonadales bacterium]|nr:helix-turn-helix transcriptional regulator [Candidatus Saccharimonadales bacterium]
MTGKNNPYDDLGKHLKKVREESKRSLSEVSGALEIDESDLHKIESGLERPDEDLMLLLISYFDMVDQEALKIWELADYDTDLDEHMEFEPLEHEQQAPPMAKPMIMLLSMEPRTMYSDGVEVSWNKAGITMEFSQATPKGPLSVSKVGMSYDQAAEVLKCLERAMLHAKYTNQTKLLPPKKNSEK